MASFGNWFCGPGSFFSGFHFGGFVPLLFWAIILYLLFKLIRGGASAEKSGNLNMESPQPAIAILEKRYAAGEINQEEFLQKKQDLGG